MHSLRKPGRPDEKQTAVNAALGNRPGSAADGQANHLRKRGRGKKECSAFLSAAIPPNAKVGLGDGY